MRGIVVLTAILTVTMLLLTANGNSATYRSKRVYTHDFITATVIVGRYYGSNVKYWLQNCSSSEGGHGGFVWYGHYYYPIYGVNNTPGGWMQFMQSTFNSNARWAFRNARHRGLRIHPRARSYFEPLGQAVVAAAMYYYHGSGSWTGARC